jgi:hypothetical protein
MRCCPNSPTRQVPRDVHEYARDVTRRLFDLAITAILNTAYPQ